MSNVRFEVVVEAVAANGGRARIVSWPIPDRCLMCAAPIVDGAGNFDATIVTMNSQVGFVCKHHPIAGRR